MDPQSFGMLGYDQADGSSCGLMANSLRKVMRLQYNTVVGVHFDKMSKEDFNNTINASWKWLDGHNLVDEQK